MNLAVQTVLAAAGLALNVAAHESQTLFT